MYYVLYLLYPTIKKYIYKVLELQNDNPVQDSMDSYERYANWTDAWTSNYIANESASGVTDT